MLKKLLSLANNFYVIGKYAECKKTLKKIIRLKPHHPTPYYILALIEEERNKIKAYNLYKTTAVLKKNDLKMYKLLYEIIDGLDISKTKEDKKIEIQYSDHMNIEDEEITIQSDNQENIEDEEIIIQSDIRESIEDEEFKNNEGFIVDRSFILKEKIFILKKLLKLTKENILVDELYQLLEEYINILKVNCSNEYIQYLLQYVLHSIDYYTITDILLDKIDELKDVGHKIIINKISKKIIRTEVKQNITENMHNRIIIYFFKNKKYSKVLSIMDHFSFKYPIEFMLIYFICKTSEEENTFEYKKEDKEIGYKELLQELLYNQEASSNNHRSFIKDKRIHEDDKIDNILEKKDIEGIKKIEDIFYEELKISKYMQNLLDIYEIENNKFLEKNNKIEDNEKEIEDLNHERILLTDKDKRIINSYIKLLYFLQLSKEYELSTTIILAELFYWIEDYNTSLIYYLKAYKKEESSNLKIIINNLKNKIKDTYNISNAFINYNFKNLMNKNRISKGRVKYSDNECKEVRNIYNTAMDFYNTAMTSNIKEVFKTNVIKFISTSKILLEDLMSNIFMKHNDKTIKSNINNISILHGLGLDEWYDLVIKIIRLCICQRNEYCMVKNTFSTIFNIENFFTLILDVYIFKNNRKKGLSLIFYCLKYSLLTNNYSLFIIGVKKLSYTYNISSLNILYYSTNIFKFTDCKEYFLYCKTVNRYILRNILKNREEITHEENNDCNSFKSANFYNIKSLSTLNNILLLCTYLPNSLYSSTVRFLDELYNEYYTEDNNAKDGNKYCDDPIGCILLSSLFISHSKSRKVSDRKYFIRKGLGLLQKSLNQFKENRNKDEYTEEMPYKYTEAEILIYFNLGRSYQFLGLDSLAEECYLKSFDSSNAELFLLSYHNLRIIYKEDKILLKHLYDKYSSRILSF
ncbi:hypothetical protein SLOPH_1653 [Spraguea lophii 42_110]|uniref:Uncharacterized protein n=1 Tax=Spraguea lophii (strain 42_110) TaxID=1358809 RepID=S7XUH3_SPRLO|nr:hypothetical protein SLOPH_1653 [Spraguea lophii 42_110]